MNPFHRPRKRNVSAYASRPPVPTAMWKTLMPDSRKVWKSFSVKLVGSVSQLGRDLSPVRSASTAYRLTGFSMSTTVERRTRSTARLEYLVVDWANNWKAPRFTMGASTAAAAVVFSISRRFMGRKFNHRAGRASQQFYRIPMRSPADCDWLEAGSKIVL